MSFSIVPPSFARKCKQAVLLLLAISGNATFAARPEIQSFSTPDTQIVAGVTIPLTWEVSGASSIVISPGVGEVTGLDVVYVSPTERTTYVLSVANSEGSTYSSLTVSVPSAIGVSPAGYTVDFIRSTGTVSTLAAADSLIAGNNVASSVRQVGLTRINFGDGGSDGELPNDLGFPDGFDDDFIVRATGQLFVNVPGHYTLAINNDDGGRLRIGGSDIIVDDALHGPRTTEKDVFLSAGSHTIDYVFFERGGGAAGELLIADESGWSSPKIVGGGDAFVSTATVVLNEVVANAGGKSALLDGDGTAQDWIELYNGTASPVDLSGYHLTDDATAPVKWSFPPGTQLGSGEFLVVFASNKADAPPPGELHTNFKLSSGGEFLALTSPGGTVVDSFAPSFPPQFEGVSYGTYDTERYLGYLPAPSPGDPNSGGVNGYVADTKFSVNRGIKDAPFTLEITSATPGAQILYTLDGSTPDFKGARNGVVYSAPLAISETSVVRAMAWKPGDAPTNTDTNTYIFPADVVGQSTAHAVGLGFPASPVNGQSVEYGMEPGIVGGNEPEVAAALTAIPTFSLVIDQDDLNGPDGIYTNAGIRGIERAASLELINEDGAGGGQFQIDCGARVRGGFSRSDGNPKHAFRFYFRGRYGATKLDYPLFGAEGANSYDIIDLRTAQNYSWSFQNSSLNTFLREVFGRDSQAAFGQPHTRSRYNHLYINGHYWGLFMTQERVGKSFGESYLGGNDDEFDTVKSGGSAEGYRTEISDGNDVAWRSLWEGVRDLRNSGSTADYYRLQGLASDGATPVAAPVLLDVDNLADYMLTIFYTGAFDTALSTFIDNASNNWFSTRNRVRNDLGFQFFYHDGEHGMGTDRNSGSGVGQGVANNRRSSDRTGPWGGSGANSKGEEMYNTIGSFDRSNPQYLHEDLANVAEYRLHFADRAFKHLVKPGGALTDEESAERIGARASTVEQVIIAEAARWGGGSNENPVRWAQARDDLLDWVEAGGNEFVGNASPPGRAAEVVSQLRAYGDGNALPLYPSIGPPTFSAPGGTVVSGFQLSLAAPGAGTTVYYSTDGSDPRGGTVYSGPITLNESATVRTRAWKSSSAEWSALDEETYLVGVLASAANIVISEIHYHPAGPLEDEYEFIEITNVGPGGGVDLSGAAFTDGILYSFPLGTVIGSGESLVVARNLAAFAERNPTVGALGPFDGKLSDKGETVTLSAQDGTVIASVTYDDAAPWSTSADGDGYSLTLAVPEAGQNYDDPLSWVSSSAIGGSAGMVDSGTFEEWSASNAISDHPEGDGDGDGMSNFFEYALGLDPGSGEDIGSARLLTRDGVDPARFHFVRSLDARAMVCAEISPDCDRWSEAPVVETLNLGDGNERVTVAVSAHPGVRWFLRLKVVN